MEFVEKSSQASARSGYRIGWMIAPSIPHKQQKTNAGKLSIYLVIWDGFSALFDAWESLDCNSFSLLLWNGSDAQPNALEGGHARGTYRNDFGVHFSNPWSLVPDTRRYSAWISFLRVALWDENMAGRWHRNMIVFFLSCFWIVIGRSLGLFSHSASSVSTTES